MIKGCFLCKKGGRFPYVFGQGRMDRIRKRIQVCDEIICQENLEANRDFLKDVEVAFSTWDTPEFTKEEIQEYFPNLKVLFYGAASVWCFARPFMECGVRILSSWKIMAVPVAQFTVSLITLANKGALLTLDLYKEKGYSVARELPDKIYPGSYQTKVGILGAGAIGSLVIKMLKGSGMEVMVYDPFLSEERELGVTRTSLEEIFSQCQTISNHIANNPPDRGDAELRPVLQNGGPRVLHQRRTRRADRGAGPGPGPEGKTRPQRLSGRDLSGASSAGPRVPEDEKRVPVPPHRRVRPGRGTDVLGLHDPAAGPLFGRGAL